MLKYRGMLLYLPLLWVLVLQVVPSSAGLNYTVVPQNVTISNGNSATFQCGINQSGVINFVVQRPEANYSLICPGNSQNFLELSLSGQCGGKAPGITAIWSISNVATTINGTIFRCQPVGLNETYAYLWIKGSSKYFAMLFGCVMGGFFGILIVFAVSYISLKRSQRLQQCFKGPDEDDEAATVETSREY